MACWAITLLHTRILESSDRPSQVGCGLLYCAAYHQPASTETGSPVIFGEAAHGHAHYIGRQCSRRYMGNAVIKNFVINLVRENHQAVFTGYLHNFFKQLLPYTAPVGLFGLMTTMALVRAVICRRMSAGSGTSWLPRRSGNARAGPRRAVRNEVHRGIVRCWDQDLITGFEQRLQAHQNQIADAVAHEYVFRSERMEAFLQVILPDCFAGLMIPLTQSIPAPRINFLLLLCGWVQACQTPKGAGLPMCSRMMEWPSFSRARALSYTGPLIS